MRKRRGRGRKIDTWKIFDGTGSPVTVEVRMDGLKFGVLCETIDYENWGSNLEELRPGVTEAVRAARTHDWRTLLEIEVRHEPLAPLPPVPATIGERRRYRYDGQLELVVQVLEVSDSQGDTTLFRREPGARPQELPEPCDTDHHHGDVAVTECRVPEDRRPAVAALMAEFNHLATRLRRAVHPDNIEATLKALKGGRGLAALLARLPEPRKSKGKCL